MTASELLTRVHERGGELRLLGPRLQYRPADALTSDELGWARAHRSDMVSVLAAPNHQDLGAFRAWLRGWFGPAHVYVGDAGDDAPAWAPIQRRSQP